MKKCFVTFAATVMLNLLAWFSPAFCDFYVEKIFPLWGKTYGRLTGIFPMSVGEYMIEGFLVMLLLAVLLGVTAVIFLLAGKICKRFGFIFGIKDRTIRFCLKYCKIYYKGMAYLLTAVFLILTLNCFILYHAPSFSKKYMDENTEEYSIEELAEVRDFVVTRVNSYAKMMDRDENGLIIYDKNMEDEAVYAMKILGKKYARLDGEYSLPKKIRHSDFLSQQYIKGYYFPFSLEANYNDVMYISSKPATMCHELAHTKGFMYEDDANFIAFLACINSDDIFFQYSGYLSVLPYLDKDFKDSLDGDMECYNSHVKISSQVKKDRAFLTEDAWTKVEKKAVFKTSVVTKATDNFLNTTLVMNGVKEGTASYSDVVELLMKMYETEEYVEFCKVEEEQ